jgi:hypothetical protein
MSNYPPPYGYQPASTSPAAIVSLVAGILGLSAFPIFGSIIAVVAGHLAKRDIAQSGGQLTGDGLATAGLVLGYIGLAVLLLGLCLFGVMFSGVCVLPFLTLPFIEPPSSWVPLVRGLV